MELSMHDSFWGLDKDEYHSCHVAGYIGSFKFETDAVSRHTYVIKHEGFFYPARHSAVLGALLDADVKRRLKKAAAPRVLKR